MFLGSAVSPELVRRTVPRPFCVRGKPGSIEGRENAMTTNY